MWWVIQCPECSLEFHMFARDTRQQVVRVPEHRDPSTHFWCPSSGGAALYFPRQKRTPLALVTTDIPDIPA